MHKQRTILLALSGAGVLSVFLSWVNVTFIGAASLSGIDTNIGKIVLVLFAIPLVISLIGEREDALELKSFNVSLITGVIAALLAIYQIFDLKAALSAGNDNPFAGMMNNVVSVGFGLYLSVLAGIALAGYSFMTKKAANDGA